MTTKKVTPAKITPASGDPADNFTVTDKSGRVLQCKHLSWREEISINSLIGRDDALNPTVALPYQGAAVVRYVNGTPHMFPTDKKQLDSALDRLGRDGWAAVAPAILARAYQVDESTDVLEEAGNSPATPDLESHSA